MPDLISEKNHIEENERLRFALNAAGIGTWELNPVTNEVLWDERCRELFGFAPDESVTYQDVLKYIDAEDAVKVNKAVQEALNPANTKGYEVQYRTNGADGKMRWVLSKGKAYFDEQGACYRFAGTAQDITALMTERERALASEKKAEIALDNSNSGYFHLVLATEELEYSEGYLRVITGNIRKGRTRSDLIKNLHPDDLHIREKAFEEAKTSGKLDYAIRVIWDDGSIHWIRAKGTFVNDTFGKPYILTGTVHDITTEYEKRSVIEEAQQLISTAFDSTAMCMAFTDTSGNFTKVNAAFCNMVGYTAGELLNLSFRQITHPDELDNNGILFKELVNHERQHFNITKRYIHKSGRDIWVQANVTYIPGNYKEGHVLAVARDITAEMNREHELAESEARFRGLIEQAPIATCLYVGREMRIEIANDIMIGIWGKGRGIMGMAIADALPELEGQPFFQLLDDVYTTGKTFEAKAMRADMIVDGILKEAYFDFTYKAVRNSYGDIYAVTNMAIDVTKEVDARKALEESELFSRSVFQHSPIAKLVFVGEDMVIKTINSKMYDMLGRDETIIGLPFMVAVPEFKELPLMQRLLNVYRTGETYYQPEEQVTLYRYGDLYTGYYNYIYKALRNTKGEIYGVMVTAVEVTEQVLSRKSVEIAEATLRGAIELAELGTWELDVANRTLNYSPRLRQWFGISNDEIITVERAYEIIRADFRDQVREGILAALNAVTDGVYDLEYYINPEISGTERILHAQGKTFYNDEGKPYKISGTVQDVTAQRKLQLALEHEVQQRTEQLQQAITEVNETNDRLMRSNEELAQYAYVASHDLQEPLRKIAIFADMLQAQQKEAGTENALLDKISQATTRMSLLIKDLLEFSRLVNSDSYVQQVDLNTVVKAITTDFELIIEEKQATMLTDNLPQIEGVGLQMNQLFYNLLNNALKFTNPATKPVIQIRSSLATAEEIALHIQKPMSDIRYHHIIFSDNGIGFEMEHAERIFEIFRRLHGKSMYAGSGIGLALCRRIVTNHNGALYAQSALGEGATFHIILPERQA